MLSMKQLRSIKGFAALVRARLDYNQKTGIFTWKNGKNKGKRAGCVGGRGYRYIKLLGRDSPLIQEANLAVLYMTGKWVEEGKEVDHINHVIVDNRWENLRVVDRTAQARNTKKSAANTSGWTGVHYDSGKEKWRACIGYKGKKIKLGTFKYQLQAVQARAWAEVLMGFHPNHGTGLAG